MVGGDDSVSYCVIIGLVHGQRQRLDCNALFLSYDEIKAIQSRFDVYHGSDAYLVRYPNRHWNGIFGLP